MWRAGLCPELSIQWDLGRGAGGLLPPLPSMAVGFLSSEQGRGAGGQGAPWHQFGDPPGSDPVPSLITTGMVWVIKN